MKRKQLLISTTTALTLSVLLTLPTVYGCVTTSQNFPSPCEPPIYNSRDIRALPGGITWEMDEEKRFVQKATQFYTNHGHSPEKAQEQAVKELEDLKRGKKPDTLIISQ